MANPNEVEQYYMNKAQDRSFVDDYGFIPYRKPGSTTARPDYRNIAIKGEPAVQDVIRTQDPQIVDEAKLAQAVSQEDVDTMNGLTPDLYGVNLTDVYISPHARFTKEDIARAASRYNNDATAESVKYSPNPYAFYNIPYTSVPKHWDRIQGFTNTVKDVLSKFSEDRWEYSDVVTPELLTALGYAESRLSPSAVGYDKDKRGDVKSTGKGVFQVTIGKHLDPKYLEMFGGDLARSQIPVAMDRLNGYAAELDSLLQNDYGISLRDLKPAQQHALLATNWNRPVAAREYARKFAALGFPKVIDKPTQLITPRHFTMIPRMVYAMQSNNPEFVTSAENRVFNPADFEVPEYVPEPKYFGDDIKSRMPYREKLRWISNAYKEALMKKKFIEDRVKSKVNKSSGSFKPLRLRPQDRSPLPAPPVNMDTIEVEQPGLIDVLRRGIYNLFSE